jgi:hypothetical protein
MNWADLGKAVVGFALGLASAYIGLHWKIRKELEGEYDKDLRGKRRDAYAALWKILQPLAKYSPPAPVTPELLKQLSADLRQWYFEVGGLYMSANARDAYFALQDELQLASPSAENAIRAGSRLRTATTRDVGSRNEPLTGQRQSA